MNRLTDQQLLHDYTDRQSEASFAELVRRHIDFVYSAALRMVRDAHLADDVTQGVFVALAQNAGKLTGRPVLSGWLHRTAQNLAANAVRSDVRRRVREQEAASMNELHEPDLAWEQLAPYLDAALGELGEADRDALLLRYFERKSAREMADVLGTSDEAAQKRVSRAVERLRESFAKRGVTIGTGGLAVAISAHAIQAAPVGLAASISAVTVSAGTTVAASVTTTANAIAMTATQKALIAATIVAAVGVGIFQAQKANALRTQIQSLQGQLAPLSEQIDQASRERDDARRQLAVARNQNNQANQGNAELLKLRNEVARLQKATDDAARATEEKWKEMLQAMRMIPPVKTYVSTAQTTAAWDQGIVTGGWKTPSGKRALVLMTLEPGNDGRQVTIQSRVMEYTEEASEKLGLAQYNTEPQGMDGPRATKVHKLTAEQAEAMLKAAKEGQGIEILEAPRVSTLSGRQAQIQSTQARSMPTGESFSTGPVIDLIPTISPDGQSVQLIFSAQLNLLIPNPHLKWD